MAQGDIYADFITSDPVPPSGSATTYATVEFVKDYISGGDTLDDAVVTDAILKAERAMNAIFPGTLEDNGLKVVVSDLKTYEQGGLARATAAQVEYMLHMGAEFFVEAQPLNPSGPDYSFTGKPPRIGPKVWEELRAVGLSTLTAGRMY